MNIHEFLDSFFSEKSNTIVEIYPSGDERIIQNSGRIDAVLLDIKPWYWHESKKYCLDVLNSSMEYHKGNVNKIINTEYSLDDILNSEIEYIDIVENTRDTLGIVIKDIKLQI